MKKLLLSAAVTALAVLTSCSVRNAGTSVIWEEGAVQEDGLAVHTVYVCNPPEGDDWTLWGSFYGAEAGLESEGDMEMKHFNGWSYYFTPKCSGHDTLVIRYRTAPLARYSCMPEGFALQRPGKADASVPVEYRTLGDEGPKDCFTWTYAEPAITDMVPSLKSVVLTEGTTEVSDYEPVMVGGKKSGWYRITLDGSVKVEAADADGAYYAAGTIDRLKANAGSSVLPNMTVEDWPDMGCRLFMLDAGRSFYTVDEVKAILDLIARYKINYFQFHLTEDEGWRIEIEGLEELTSYGAFHKLPERQPDGTFYETEALHPSFDGSIDPEDKNSNTQGYYSRADMIDIIRYAADRHITVIPEIDAPGHSYAAVMSMEARFRRTGDDSLRLMEPEDKSEYLSCNNNRFNALNAGLPSTYRFIERVIDGLVSIWEEAGYPLSVVNMGGDEVAAGSWKESPACKAVDLQGAQNLHEYFVDRVLDIFEPRGLKIAGWQEMAMNLGPAGKARLLKNVAYVNAWSTGDGMAGLPYMLANEGFPVIVGNSDLAYLDLAYNDSRVERGLSWSGYVDEYRTFSLLPYNIYRSVGQENDVALEKPENIIGTGSFLWGENLRNFDQATYAIFPKGYGLFERAWNATPAWDMPGHSTEAEKQAAFDRFYSSVVKYELPWLESKGINYRHNQ